MKNILVLILASIITIVSKGQDVNLGTYHIFETNRITYNCNDPQTFPDKIMMYSHRWVFQDGSEIVTLHHLGQHGEVIHTDEFKITGSSPISKSKYDANVYTMINPATTYTLTVEWSDDKSIVVRSKASEDSKLIYKNSIYWNEEAKQM